MLGAVCFDDPQKPPQEFASKIPQSPLELHLTTICNFTTTIFSSALSKFSPTQTRGRGPGSTSARIPQRRLRNLQIRTPGSKQPGLNILFLTRVCFVRDVTVFLDLFDGQWSIFGLPVLESIRHWRSRPLFQLAAGTCETGLCLPGMPTLLRSGGATDQQTPPCRRFHVIRISHWCYTFLARGKNHSRSAPRFIYLLVMTSHVAHYHAQLLNHSRVREQSRSYIQFQLQIRTAQF